MAKMRIYTAHINPRKKNPYESPVFIEESFNFFAFIFHWMWALSQRLWLVALGVLAFWIFINYLNFQRVLHPVAVLALQIGFQAFIGFQANDLKRNKLKHEGYITTDVVTSDNLVGAEQRFFERYYPSGRQSQASASHSLPATA